MIHAFVITGFLGVGKSTMLTNTVREHFKDKKVAIIVNEFGEVGIDGKILKNVHSEVLEISEGCICCKLAEEFERGVIEIIQNYNPEVIFVETSGASEPFPIFLSLKNLGIIVEGIICVVDAKNFAIYRDNQTAKYQLGGSNIIIINKIDLIKEDSLELLKKEVMDIHKEFTIKNNLTGKTVFNNTILSCTSKGYVEKELFEGIYRVDELQDIAKDHTHHDHTTRDSITQKPLYIQSPCSFEELERLLKALPKSIFRVKGVVKLEDIPQPLIINYAFGDISYEELAEYDKPSILICIGFNIEDDVSNMCKNFSFLKMQE
ncbi:MAG: CobW family GTP-binding protein [Campylobacterales bacterium]